jgi:hypothetical protein
MLQSFYVTVIRGLNIRNVTVDFRNHTLHVSLAGKVVLSDVAGLEPGHPEVILANSCGNGTVGFMKSNETATRSIFPATGKVSPPSESCPVAECGTAAAV